MKKKVAIICSIYCIIVLTLFKLVFSYFFNEKIIFSYNNGIYNENDVKKLLIFNIFEPCVARYNYGNILYQKGDFDLAITEYKKALSFVFSEPQECSIRINLALAMLKKIDFEIEEKDAIIQKLNEAEEVLCEKGCASMDDINFHNDTAQTLKNDIENMKNKINDTKSDEKKEDIKEQNKSDKDISKEKEIKEKLKQIQKESQAEREEGIKRVNRIERYEYYDGKKW